MKRPLTNIKIQLRIRLASCAHSRENLRKLYKTLIILHGTTQRLSVFQFSTVRFSTGNYLRFCTPTEKIPRLVIVLNSFKDLTPLNFADLSVNVFHSFCIFLLIKLFSKAHRVKMNVEITHERTNEPLPIHSLEVSNKKRRAYVNHSG